MIGGFLSQQLSKAARDYKFTLYPLALLIGQDNYRLSRGTTRNQIENIFTLTTMPPPREAPNVLEAPGR